MVGEKVEAGEMGVVVMAERSGKMGWVWDDEDNEMVAINCILKYRHVIYRVFIVLVHGLLVARS